MPPGKKRSPGRHFYRWCFRQSGRILIILILLTVLQVLSLRFINPGFTVRYAGEWLRKTVTRTSVNLPCLEWRPLEHLSPALRRSVLAAEDQRFLSHHGFDFVEMNTAIEEFFQGKRRGASTISMQTARTVFLWPSPSIRRKLAEAYYTLLIELLWSKQRILEVYLNTVDWGSGVMGAEAAARKYFKTGSNTLTESQAALLVAILPNPHRWSPVHPSDYIKERQKRIMRESKKMPLLGG